MAPAATSPANDLVVVRLKIHDDGTTQQHVEILEWDRVLMSSMYGAERREVRPHAAVKTYAMQIGGKFQGIPHRARELRRAGRSLQVIALLLRPRWTWVGRWTSAGRRSRPVRPRSAASAR